MRACVLAVVLALIAAPTVAQSPPLVAGPFPRSIQMEVVRPDADSAELRDVRIGLADGSIVWAEEATFWLERREFELRGNVRLMLNETGQK